ncbi:MAG: hypothetical protein ABII74_05915 [Elusimicrobiota bacterium]
MRPKIRIFACGVGKSGELGCALSRRVIRKRLSDIFFSSKAVFAQGIKSIAVLGLQIIMQIIIDKS